MICPDYSEVAKFADLWMHPKQGTDAALAMAMGHVILKEFYFDRQVEYFDDYARRYTDMPMLVRLVKQGDRLVPDRCCAPPTSTASSGETNNPGLEDRRLRRDDRRARRAATARSASAGARRASGTSRRRTASGARRQAARCRSPTIKDEIAAGRLPLLRRPSSTTHFAGDRPSTTCWCATCRCKRVELDGRRGAGRHGVRPVRAPTTASTAASAASTSPSRYDDDVPYTPAWAEKITGVPRDQIITVAREFAAQRREDQGPVDGDHRRGDEPLVPHAT